MLLPLRAICLSSIRLIQRLRLSAERKEVALLNWKRFDIIGSGWMWRKSIYQFWRISMKRSLAESRVSISPNLAFVPTSNQWWWVSCGDELSPFLISKDYFPAEAQGNSIIRKISSRSMYYRQQISGDQLLDSHSWYRSTSWRRPERSSVCQTPRLPLSATRNACIYYGDGASPHPGGQIGCQRKWHALGARVRRQWHASELYEGFWSSYEKCKVVFK